jgi:hypothetical protein
MSNQSLTLDSWDTWGFDMFTSPARFVGLWNPFLIGMTHYNGHAADGIVTLIREWQHFVGHRLTQDMQFMQQLATCKSSDEITAAYADYWWNAYAEYAKEFTTMNKLLSGITTKVLSKPHSASKEAAKTIPV